MTPNSTQLEQEGKILIEDFLRVDIRSGTIVRAEAFPQARKPAYKLWVDFGEELGILQTSAQITQNYDTLTLPGMQVVGVVNLAVKKIAGFESQFLVLGFCDPGGNIRLIQPHGSVCNGERLH